MLVDSLVARRGMKKENVSECEREREIECGKRFMEKNKYFIPLLVHFQGDTVA